MLTWTQGRDGTDEKVHARSDLQLPLSAGKHHCTWTGFCPQLLLPRRRPQAVENYLQVFISIDNATIGMLKKISRNFLFARFVAAMVNFYYPTASDVQRDSELQEWISEVFTHGFLGNKDSGRDETLLRLQVSCVVFLFHSHRELTLSLSDKKAFRHPSTLLMKWSSSSPWWSSQLQLSTLHSIMDRWVECLRSGWGFR